MDPQLQKILQDLEIEYEMFEHNPFFTCEESESFYQKNIPDGAKCKSLFLRNRKGDKHYLALVESHKKVDVKDLAEFLDENQKMSFASEERLKKHLNLTPGSVGLFGLVYNEEADIPVIVDKGILGHEHVHFHPNRNTATLRFLKDDLMKFLKTRGNQTLFFEF